MEVSAFPQSGCRSLSARARLSHTVPIAHGTKRARSEGCDFFFFPVVCYATHDQKNLSKNMPEQPVSAFNVA